MGEEFITKSNCYYCMEGKQKIGRHLSVEHKAEKEVAEICGLDMSTKEGNKKRQLMLNDLRCRR